MLKAREVKNEKLLSHVKPVILWVVVLLCLVFIGLSGMDLLTTYWGLQIPGVGESNGLALSIFNDFSWPGMIAVKVIIVLVGISATFLLLQTGKDLKFCIPVAIGLITVFDAYFAWVVINNLVVIGGG